MYRALPCSDYYGSSVAMPDFQCLPHSPYGRSGLGNLQLTEVVGKCELSDMLSFRWHRFSGAPCISLITYRKATLSGILITGQKARLSELVCTIGFRQISYAHTEQGLGTHKIQTKIYPHIHLSSQFSRTRLPLGDLPLSWRAIVPCQLSPFG